MTSLLLLQPNEIFVAPGDRKEFDELHAAIAHEFAPSTEFQRQCAKTILHSLWTIRRTRLLEAHLQQKAFGAHGLEGLFTVESSKQFKDVLALRRQAERSYERALRDFRATAPAPVQQKKPQQQPKPQPSAPPARAQDSTEKPHLVVPINAPKTETARSPREESHEKQAAG